MSAEPGVTGWGLMLSPMQRAQEQERAQEQAVFRKGTPGTARIPSRAFARRSTGTAYTLDPEQVQQVDPWEPVSLKGEGGMLTPKGK